MTRKRPRRRPVRGRRPGGRRLPSFGSLAVIGAATAFAAFVAMLVVNGAMSGGGGGGSEGGRPDFEGAIAETPSEDSSQPFSGGARLYFPIQEIDLGHVPLNTNVGYSFAMSNVGDAEAEIQDVNVRALEGC